MRIHNTDSVDAVFVPKIIKKAFALPIFMMAGYFGPHFSPSKASSMDEEGVSLSTVSSSDMQGVSISKASRMDMQSVSISKASRMDIQGVSISKASRMDFQGVSLSTASSMDMQGVLYLLSPPAVRTCWVYSCHLLGVWTCRAYVSLFLYAGMPDCPASG
jgi:hypothetical protein